MRIRRIVVVPLWLGVSPFAVYGTPVGDCSGLHPCGFCCPTLCGYRQGGFSPRPYLHLSRINIYTTLGAGTWNIVLAGIGYAIYKMFPAIDTPQKVADKAAEYSHVIGYAILAVVAIVAIYFLVKHLKKK